MNKLILLLALIMVGCATNQPTRTVLNCQSGYVVDPDALFIGGSRINDTIECKEVRLPIAPKAIPLEVRPELIDKNQK
jgi:hypothetical protein